MNHAKLLAVSMVLVLAGCATAPPVQYASNDGTKRHTARIVRDRSYMDAVETEAARQNVDVIWINAPNLGPGGISLP